VVDGQCHALATLPSAKGLEVKGDWIGLLAGLEGTGKSLPPSGFEFRTVQTLASRCTDYVFLAHGRVYIENLVDGGTTYVNTDRK